MPPTFSVLIVSAGSGKRFGDKKQFCQLGGLPLFFHSYLAFQNLVGVKDLVLVINLEDKAQYKSWFEKLASEYPLNLAYSFIGGGVERYLSVRNGLSQCTQPFVFIHDAARPLIRKSDLELLAKSLVDSKEEVATGVVPCSPVTDTIKMVDQEQRVVENLKRNSLMAVSTPQGFPLDELKKINQQLSQGEKNNIPTDDVEVFMTVKNQVKGVSLKHPNPKITYPYDLTLAEKIYVEDEVFKERLKLKEI